MNVESAVEGHHAFVGIIFVVTRVEWMDALMKGLSPRGKS